MIFFEITKENYQVYWAFEKLLTDIKGINIFAEEEINFSSYLETDEEINFSSYLETDEEKRQYMETLELNKKIIENLINHIIMIFMTKKKIQ